MSGAGEIVFDFLLPNAACLSLTNYRLEPRREKLDSTGSSSDGCSESSGDVAHSCSSSSAGSSSGEEDDQEEVAREGRECVAASELQLQDLRWVATLGVGGFGRVELVTCGERSFALKKIKKSEVNTMQ